jgi:hypothetical protein
MSESFQICPNCDKYFFHITGTWKFHFKHSRREIYRRLSAVTSGAFRTTNFCQSFISRTIKSYATTDCVTGADAKSAPAHKTTCSSPSNSKAIRNSKRIWKNTFTSEKNSLPRLFQSTNDDNVHQGPMLWFLKIFSPKIQRKNWRFWLQTKARLCKILITILVFEKKSHFFRRKLS